MTRTLVLATIATAFVMPAAMTAAPKFPPGTPKYAACTDKLKAKNLQKIPSGSCWKGPHP